MRPLSSKAMATGETTVGSAATNSIFKVGSILKVFRASCGDNGPSNAWAKETPRQRRDEIPKTLWQKAIGVLRIKECFPAGKGRVNLNLLFCGASVSDCGKPQTRQSSTIANKNGKTDYESGEFLRQHGFVNGLRLLQVG